MTITFRDRVAVFFSSTRFRVIVLGAIAFAALVLPLLFEDRYLLYTVTLMGCFTVLTTSVSVATGVAGQATLGQGALFAIGAYAVGYTSVILQWPPVLGLVLALVLSVAFAGLLGLASLRLSYMYLAIVTLGFAMIVQQLLVDWKDVTGGAEGLLGIPPIELGDFDPAMVQYYVTFAVVAGATWLLWTLRRSRYGKSLIAVRDNELAARALGINPFSAKLSVFMLAGGLAGLAGVLYAHLAGFLHPDSFDLWLSVDPVVYSLVGGMQSALGPILGTGLVFIVESTLLNADSYHELIYGGLLLFALFVIPKGVAGAVKALFRVHIPSARLDQLRELAVDRVAAAVPDADGRGEGGTLLAVRGISKSFGGVKALQDVDLKIERGTVHGVVGPNGSGKSTLINVITGLIPQDRGEVIFDGTVIDRRPAYARARYGIRRTFQGVGALGALSIEENLDLGSFKGLTPELAREFIEASVQRDRAARSGIEPGSALAKTPVSELPYGFRKIAEILRCVVPGGTLYILDEPVSGMTSEEADLVAEVITQLRSTGATVLLVEHNMAFIQRVCDRMSVMRSGSVILEGTPSEVFAMETFQSSYLGEES